MKPGKVVSIQGDMAEVQWDRRTTTVPISDLTVVALTDDSMQLRPTRENQRVHVLRGMYGNQKGHVTKMQPAAAFVQLDGGGQPVRVKLDLLHVVDEPMTSEHNDAAAEQIADPPRDVERIRTDAVQMRLNDICRDKGVLVKMQKKEPSAGEMRCPDLTEMPTELSLCVSHRDFLVSHPQQRNVRPLSNARQRSYARGRAVHGRLWSPIGQTT